MSERPPWQPFDAVTFRLARKFVTIPGYNQEILDVDSDRLSVRTPERSDRVEQECQGVHPEIIQLLVLVPIVLLQRRKLRNLRDDQMSKHKSERTTDLRIYVRRMNERVIKLSLYYPVHLADMG